MDAVRCPTVAEERPAQSRPLVVVADDDPDILGLVAFPLERAGYVVITASDGAQALAAIREHRPTVAILDVTMPKLNGYEITEQLRADASTRHIGVILLTARVQEADIARGYDAGADDYLQKPFSPQELETHVRALADRT